MTTAPSEYEELLESFWESRGHLAKTTILEGRRVVRWLLEYLALRDLTLERMGKEDLTAFAIWMRKKIPPTDGKKNPAASTVAKLLTALRKFLRYLFEEAMIFEPLHRQVESCRVSRSLPRPLELDEIEGWFRLCDMDCPLGLRDRAFFELAYGSGLRRGELLALELSHVDLVELVVRVEKSKNGRARVTPMTRRASVFLSGYLERARPELLGANAAEPYIWVNVSGGRLNGDGVANRLKSHYMSKLTFGKKLNIHALRHSFATHLVRGGADVRHVGEMLGHTSLESTTLYTEVAMTDLVAMLAAHPLALRGRASC